MEQINSDMSPKMKPLADLLKESIIDRHSLMEEIPYVKALMSGDLPLNSYVSHLRAMAIIHGAMEQAMPQLPISVSRNFLGRPSRLAHLRADLGDLDKLNIPDCIAAVEQAQRIAENIRIISIQQPEGLLGFLYVLEGTTLGNMVHLQDVYKALGDKVGDATRYYSGYKDNTLSYWDEFRALINALPVEEAKIGSIISAAHKLFDMLEPLFVALYPVSNLGWGFTATALNPEAGKHPVPQDLIEIQAAVDAASKCREEYPYFDERYKDRGKAFAKSDAAWLAALVDLSYNGLMAQVQWLGRVLGNRGMPRITLERQLQLLYEQLSSAIPQRQPVYKSLLEASVLLREERLCYIADESFKTLSMQFYHATNGELQGRMLRTGELILSAVCDERAGIMDALNSMIPWLTDPDRFSNDWIVEVKRLLSLGRESLLR